MNDEEFRRLVLAVYNQELARAGALGVNEKDALWRSIEDRFADLPDDALLQQYQKLVQLPTEQFAGQAAELTGGDSTNILRHWFNPDSARALSGRVDSALTARSAPPSPPAAPPRAPISTAAPAQPVAQGAIPASRQQSIDQSPIRRVMRAVPGMTQEYAQAMPPSRQAAILRSDAANFTTPAKSAGTMAHLGAAFGNEFNRSNRLTQDLEEMGVGTGTRFMAGLRTGAPRSAHYLAKGALGAARGVGLDAPYEAYTNATRNWEQNSETESRALGKLGMAGNIVGAAPVDLPLYAFGGKALQALPLLRKMMAGGPGAQMGGRVLANTGVDALQGAVMASGDSVPSANSYGANIGMNLAFGTPFTIGGEAHAAARMLRGAFEGTPSPSASGRPPREVPDRNSEREVERIANAIYQYKTRNRRPDPSTP